MDWALLVLPLATLITAALTGVVGMGGGLLLILIMAEFLTFAALIPVHGFNQLITHLSRTLVSPSSVDSRITLQFAVGALAGAAVGSQFVLSMSEGLFKLLLGFFVLASLLLPKIRIRFHNPAKWPLVGALTSFCGLFVGATGVVMAPFYLNEALSKEQLVATKAASQVFIHGAKVVTFFLLGFSLAPYWLLILLMGIMSFIGSLMAKHILHRLPDKGFDILFKVTIVILSIKLIYTGLLALIL